MKTQTELALRQTPSGETRATLRQLQTATEQTTRLVNQLLSLARAEPGTDRPVAAAPVLLSQLAREATTEWVPSALAREIDLGFDSAGDDQRIEGDAFLLREMLNNLLDNAIRYTHRGGQVTVTVRAESGDVMLRVEDNGPGIPEAERERVFERFYRVLGTGVDGCGLGLAIVKEIAHQHGAKVTLAIGAGGRGTIVTLRFPSGTGTPVATSS